MPSLKQRQGPINRPKIEPSLGKTQRPRNKIRLDSRQDPYQRGEEELEEFLEQVQEESRKEAETLILTGEEEVFAEEAETDFDQYEEDANPFLDEDEPNHLESAKEADLPNLPEDWVVDSPGAPKPSIVLEFAGDRLAVRIPLEDWVFKISQGSRQGNFWEEPNLNTLENKLIRDLRRIGDAILDRNEDILSKLDSDWDKVKISIRKIQQKEFLEKFEENEEDVGKHKGSLSRLIRNHFLEAPATGVVPLSWFFYTREEKQKDVEREEVLSHIQEIIEKEPLNNPYNNKFLWSEARRRIEKKGTKNLLHALEKTTLYNYRTLANWMRKGGIPLCAARKQLCEKISEFLEKENIKSLSASEIPELNTRLMEKYGLFKGSAKGPTAVAQYRHEHYSFFVEARIRKILLSKGVNFEEK